MAANTGLSLCQPHSVTISDELRREVSWARQVDRAVEDHDLVLSVDDEAHRYDTMLRLLREAA